MQNYDNIIKYLELLELHIDKQIDINIVKSQYRMLCKKYHPDYTDVEEYKDGKLLKDITIAYKYLNDNIDYVNSLLTTDIEALEQRKREIENQRLSDLQSLLKQQENDKEVFELKRKEIEIKRKEQQELEIKQYQETLNKEKEDIINNLNQLQNTITKDKYSYKNIFIINNSIKKFIKNINTYYDIDILKKEYEHLINKINNIPFKQKIIINKKIITISIISICSLVLLTLLSIMLINNIRVDKARKYLKEGQYEDARELLLKTNNKEATILLNQIPIYEALNEGNYDYALYLFEKHGKYEIKYNPNGGVIDEEVFIDKKYNSYYSCDKVGYKFNDYELSNYIITEDFLTIYLKAKYKAIMYSIEYELYGGENHPNNPKLFLIESNDLTINPPTRKGYKFLGWKTSLESDEIFEQYVIKKGTMKNIELYAVWEANSYEVIYDYDDGTTSPLKEQVKYGSYISLPVPTKPGYTFLGWYLGEEKINNGYWEMDQNVTLKAKWAAKSYIITCSYFNGTKTIETILTVSTGDYYVLTTPTRPGYTFIGWYKGEQRFENGQWLLTNNITVNAKWKANTYSIEYDLDGGKLIETATKSIIYDEEIILPVPIKDGYIFDGWYYNNQKVENGIWKIDQNVTLKAKWIEAKNLILYNLDGGTNNKQNPKTYQPGTQLLILSPTKPGYNFIGWTTKDNEKPIKNYFIPSDQEGDVVLTAVWEVIKYKISYKVDNVIYDTQTITYGSILKLKEVTKPGHEFVGWYDTNSIKYNDGIYTLEKDLVLVARWKVKTYTVTFVLNGGAIIGGNTRQYTYDSHVKLPTPSKPGYEFLGWYYNDERLNEILQWQIDTEDNKVSLIARWQEK